MKRCFLLSLMVVGLSAYANNTHANDTATIDGYKLHGCTTGGGKNYCTTDKKEISKIIGKSKELKTANFAQNKKLVQLFYQGKNSPITDIFVIDDKAKSIYLYPQFAWFDWSIEEKQTYPKKAPKVISNKKVTPSVYINPTHGLIVTNKKGKLSQGQWWNMTWMMSFGMYVAVLTNMATKNLHQMNSSKPRTI